MKQNVFKKTIKYLGVILLAIGTLLTASGCSIRPIRWSSQSVELDQEDKFKADNLKRLIVNTAGADVSIILTNEREVKFHYYGNARVTSAHENFKPYIDIDESSSSLTLSEKIGDRLNGISYSGNIKLDIYLSEDYAENLKLNTASGSVDIQDYKGNCDINTASGDIDADNCDGDFLINTVSGYISYSKDSKFTSNLNFNSVSGDINVSIAKDSEFGLKSKTVSGKIKCDFPVTLEGRGVEGTVGSGKNHISANTVSGNITIKSN